MSERTPAQLKGDEFIDHMAKTLIKEGLHKVTRNMAAFAFIFGKDELLRMQKYAFDYTYKSYEIRPRAQHHENQFTDDVFRNMDIIAYQAMSEYQNTPPKYRASIKLEYPTGKDLEKIVRTNERSR